MIKQVATNILNSFNNHEKGFSARKLSAFTLMACIVWVHYKWINHDNVAEVLIIDLCGVLILLGIITAEQIIKFKNDKPNESNKD